MENVSTVSTPTIKNKVLVNIAKNLRPAEFLPSVGHVKVKTKSKHITENILKIKKSK